MLDWHLMVLIADLTFKNLMSCLMIIKGFPPSYLHVAYWASKFFFHIGLSSLIQTLLILAWKHLAILRLVWFFKRVDILSLIQISVLTITILMTWHHVCDMRLILRNLRHLALMLHWLLNRRVWRFVSVCCLGFVLLSTIIVFVPLSSFNLIRMISFRYANVVMLEFLDYF